MAKFNNNLLRRSQSTFRLKLLMLTTSPSVTSHRFKATSTTASCPVIDDVDVSESASSFAAKPLKDIPGPRGIYNIPYIGMLLQVKPFGRHRRDCLHLLMNEMHERYGPIFRFQSNQLSIVVSDPEDIAKVFRYEGKYPERPPLSILDKYHQRSGIKRGLDSAQGKDWHTMRTPMAKLVMRPGSISQYLPPMNAVADDFINLLSNGYLEHTDPYEAFSRFAAESAAIPLFNTRIGLLDSHHNQEATDLINATSMAFDIFHKTALGMSLSYNWYRSKVYKEFEYCMGKIYGVANKQVRRSKEIVERKKRDGTWNPDEPNLLLSMISDPSMSESDACRVTGSMFMGAIDSTASTLQAFYFVLAKNPDKQEKLRNEIHQITSLDEPITKEQIDRMVYLKASLKESFRLNNPLLLGTFRKLPVDVVLGGYKVPAGVQIYTFNRRTCFERFEDAHSFLPERWLRQGGLSRDEAGIWGVLPFSYGPRNCLGRRIAEQEIYLAVAKTIQKLKIELEPESQDTEFTYPMFLKPVEPLKFRMTKI